MKDEKLAVVKSIIQIGATPDMKELTEHIINLFREGDWMTRELPSMDSAH